MAKSLLPLRASLFPMGVMVRPDGHGVSGASADTVTDFISLLPDFNVSIQWVTDNAYIGLREKDGRYSGVLGQFANNESDAMLLTLPMSPDADLALMGPPTSSSPSVLVSLIDVKEYPDMILNQLFRFSADIVVLLLMAILSFAVVLKISVNRRFKERESRERQGNELQSSHQKVSLFRSAWHMISLMLKQAQQAPDSRLATRVLLVMTAIAVFFWYQMWENQMKTEMFVFDTRSTAQSVDDALRMNLTAILYSTDPSERQLEHMARRDPKSKMASLFRSARIVSSDLKERRELSSLLTRRDFIQKHVVIINSYVFDLAEEIICLLGPYKFLVAKDRIGDQLQGPWYNRLLRKDYQRLLDKRYVRAREFGIEGHTKRDVARMTRDLRKQSMPDLRQCVYRSLDSYLDEVSDEKPLVESVSVSGTRDVFRLLSSCLTAAIIVLVIERLIHRLNKRREMRRVTQAIVRETRKEQDKTENERKWNKLSDTLRQNPLPIPPSLRPQIQ